jgi:hypothetical protein
MATTLMAQDRTPFPQPATKKGIQVQMTQDAIDLGIKHATLNVNLNSLWQHQPTAQSIRFEYEQQTFHLNPTAVASLDSKVKPLTDAGVVVYAILLLYPSKVTAQDQQLLHPAAVRDVGKFTVAGFRTDTAESRRLLSAMISFLAQRYSGEKPAHGRIWGWIVGNEVNSQQSWSYTGAMKMNDAVDNYERAFRLIQQAVKQHSLHGRCYISLDHFWTMAHKPKEPELWYPGRAYLDRFAELVRERGDFEWHVAYHPYPENLLQPRTWLDKTATTDADTKRITFKNLEVLCQYLKRPELQWQKQPRRIILSEQGIHCEKSEQGEQLQAAGFAYVWEKVQRQAGIDALIWHRHVDHAKEGGLRVGLWENKPNTIVEPGRKRPIYALFQQAGTPTWPQAAEFALPIIGIKNWNELPASD